MNNNHINRRNFLKVMGVGAGAAATVTIPGCSPKKDKSMDDADFSTAPVPLDKMTYRTDEHTHAKVSLLGYGCMRFPSKTNEKGEDILDQEAVDRLIDYAIAHGINYFDTAPAYGQSEDVVGISLSRYPRNKYLLATKMSNFDPSTWSLEAAKRMYHNSFKRLKVDYFDYYLLHVVGQGGLEHTKTRFIDNGLIDFLMKEREAGRIRNLGFSFHGDVAAYDYMLAQHDKYKWDFVQIQLNYVDWENHGDDKGLDASYLYGELEKRNIQAIIMEPLLGGRLARLTPTALAMLKKIHPDLSPASWAFRFAGDMPLSLTVLSGMTYMEHLQDNIRTFSPLTPLTADEKQTLKTIADLMLHSELIPCTQCKYCMPCPYGLNIPEVFAHYNRCVNDKMLPKSSADSNYEKARREFLYGYDRSVPKLRQASHCIGCKQCEPKCPQGIAISDEMHRIDKLTENLKQNLPFDSAKEDAEAAKHEHH
ncbi:MAG: aldo/keto reductase [Parabacteroides sp.]